MHANCVLVNIYSHAVGAALFALLPIHFYLTQYSETAHAKPADALVVVLYLLGTSVCFSCSTWLV